MKKYNTTKDGRWKTYSDYIEEQLEVKRKNLNRKIIKIAFVIFVLTICSFVIWFSFS